MPSFVYIEDDETSRRVMDIMLRRFLKYTDVTILPDSEAFKQRLDAMETAPDVILLDIHMQPHSGFEVLKALRQDGRYSGSRIVALTASIMNEEVELLREAGFDGVIGKPVDSRTFPDLLNRVLSGERVWRPT